MLCGWVLVMCNASGDTISWFNVCTRIVKGEIVDISHQNDHA